MGFQRKGVKLNWLGSALKIWALLLVLRCRGAHSASNGGDCPAGFTGYTFSDACRSPLRLSLGLSDSFCTRFFALVLAYRAHENLARSCGQLENGPCTVSQSTSTYGAELAVDANLTSTLAGGSCSQTAENSGPFPWWMVDFGRQVQITGLRVYNRGDCCQDSLEGFDVFVGDSNDSNQLNKNTKCANNQAAPTNSPYYADVSCSSPITGRYLYISLNGAKKVLTLCEVQITGADQTAFTSISTRGSAPVGSEILPSYIALGGPTGRGYVSFNRAKSQFLNAGTRTLNIRSNGGLTIVSVLRFKGDPKEMERIVDLGNGPENNNIILARGYNSHSLFFQVLRGQGTSGNPAQRLITNPEFGNFSENTWLTVVVRYKASSLEFHVKVNEEGRSGNASGEATDETYSGTLLGKSHWNDPYLDADVAGVFVVDEYLSTDASSYVAESMMIGKDFTETKVTCTACKPGTFKSASGSSACDMCPPGKYSVINGSSSNTTCLNCPPGTYLETIGNDALSDCMACAAGKYSVINGSSSVTACLNCPPGTYLETIGNDALSDCMACAAGKYSVINGSSSNTTCLNCPPGTYLETIVAWRTIGNDALSDCMACVPGMYSVMNGSSSITACLNCPPGTYLETIGNDALSDCMACAAGKYSVINGSSSVTTCLNCLPGKYSVINGSSSNTTCLNCPPGTYLETFGNNALSHCIACAAGKYSVVNGSSSCLACPASSISSAGASSFVSCTCIAGYSGPDGDTCTACVAGKYKAALGSSICIDCETGKYSAAVGSSSSSTCSICPLHSNSSAASIKRSDCKCKPGYTGNGGIIENENSSCTICQRDHYKDTNGSAACTSCPPFSNSIAGSTNRRDCLCHRGYSRIIESDNSTCEMCLQDHYKDTNGSAACTQCPPFSRAMAGSVDPRDCKCNTGVYGYVWNSTTNICDLFPRFVSCGIDCLMKRGHWSCNTTCGDGLRAGLEQCDDGNIQDADGCSANCTLELGFNCTLIELSTLSASLLPSERVLGAPSVCSRDTCAKENFRNPSVVTVAAARAAAAAVSVAVGVAVSAGVAAGVAGGSAGGSAGGGGGGAGVLLLINQVQVMNIAGRVLGPGDGEGSPQRGIWAFGQGFGWSNYDFPVGGAADGDEIQSETGDRRVIVNGTRTDCEWVQGKPLLKRFVTCVVIISVVFSIKKLVLWAYMHKYPEAEMPVWLPPFPSIEGSLFLTQIFGLLDVSFKLTTSKCTAWIVVGSICLVTIVAFAGICVYRDGDMQWAKCQLKTAQMLEDECENMRRSQRMYAYCQWYYAKRKNMSGEWSLSTPRARFWSFCTDNFSTFAWQMLCMTMLSKFFSALILNCAPGVTGGFLMISFHLFEALLVFKMAPMKDNWQNYVHPLCYILNATSILLVALCSLLSHISIPQQSMIAMMIIVASTGIEMILILFDPLIELVAMICSALSSFTGIKSSTLLLVEGLEHILLGPSAFASVFFVEAKLRRRAFDAPGKLELSAFLCWKHAALHDVLNRWIGTRFGDVVAFQHAVETRKTCTKSLEYGLQVYKGHAHEEKVKLFSPWLAESIEYPDKNFLELVLELDMSLGQFKIGKERATFRDEVRNDIAQGIEGAIEKIMVIFFKPTHDAPRRYLPSSGRASPSESMGAASRPPHPAPPASLPWWAPGAIKVGVRLLPGVCGMDKRLVDVFEQLLAQVGVEDSLLMQGAHTCKTLQITLLESRKAAEEEHTHEIKSVPYIVEKILNPSRPEFEGRKVQIIQTLPNKWAKVNVISSDRMIIVKQRDLELPFGIRCDCLLYPTFLRLIRNYLLSVTESHKEPSSNAYQDCQDPELRQMYTLKSEVDATVSPEKDAKTEAGLNLEDAKPDAGTNEAKFELHDFHDCEVLQVSEVLQDCAVAPPHPEVSADFVTGRGNADSPCIHPERSEYSHIPKEERIRLEHLQARLALSRHRLAEQAKEQDTIIQERIHPTVTTSAPSFSTSFKSSTFREYMLHGSQNGKNATPVAEPQLLHRREDMYFKV